MKNQRKNPLQNRSLKTFQNILETSRQILIHEGPLKFSTNLIAKKSGISVGSIYQYFQSKEKILELLIEKEISSSLKKFDEKIKNLFEQSVEEKVTGLVQSISSMMKENEYLIQAHQLFKLNDRLNLQQIFHQQIFRISQSLLVSENNQNENKSIENLLIIIRESFYPSFTQTPGQTTAVLSSMLLGAINS